MTQEDKVLLLKDLCARLPYGVKVNNEIQGDFEVYGFCENYIFARTTTSHADFRIENIKPYLFPLSSMTDEQCYMFYCKFVENETAYNDFKKYYFDSHLWNKILTSINDCGDIMDWFNKNYFDYRGLIKKSLALDATNLGIYE